MGRELESQKEKSLVASIIIERKGGVIFSDDREDLGIAIDTVKFMNKRKLLDLKPFPDETGGTTNRVAYTLTQKGKEAYESAIKLYSSNI